MTVNLATVAATLGLGWFQAQAPQLAIAYWVFRDVAWDSPLYADLGRVGRLWLGVRAGWIIFWRFVPEGRGEVRSAVLERPVAPHPRAVTGDGAPSVTVAPRPRRSHHRARRDRRPRVLVGAARPDHGPHRVQGGVAGHAAPAGSAPR